MFYDQVNLISIFKKKIIFNNNVITYLAIDQEKLRLNREEDLYKQEILHLEKDLSDLELTVEELRTDVINRKTRVNIFDVENMALVLTRSSKTVADLKLKCVFIDFSF